MGRGQSTNPLFGERLLDTRARQKLIDIVKDSAFLVGIPLESGQTTVSREPQQIVVENQTEDFRAWFDLQGKLHQDGTPALIHGAKQIFAVHGFDYAYLENGLPHRTDGPAKTNKYGDQYWYYQGQLHREDGPACIDEDGKRWFKHGVLHRDKGPAVKEKHKKVWVKDGLAHRKGDPAMEYKDGSWIWYQKGQIHRTDGPAKFDALGKTLFWYQNGFLHRDNGPAEEAPDGMKWYQQGVLHREDGPAVDLDYLTAWATYGKYHRLDGPAKIFKEGKQEFFVAGRKTSKERYPQRVEEFKAKNQ